MACGALENLRSQTSLEIKKMSNDKNKEIIEGYVKFYETMTRRSLPLIQRYVEDGIYFKDPFNRVHGIEKVIQIFEHMFANVDEPKFKVRDVAYSDDAHTVYLRWDFTYRIKGQSRNIEGMSEVMISPNGKIVSHVDYWDAGEYFYEHIPMLGGAMRWIKSKLAV